MTAGSRSASRSRSATRSCIDAGLARAEHLAGPAQLEVLLRDAKPSLVSRSTPSRSRASSDSGALVQQHAARRLRAAADAAAQLMQLRQAHALGILDRPSALAFGTSTPTSMTVVATSSSRSAALNARITRLLVGRLHAAVNQADAHARAARAESSRSSVARRPANRPARIPRSAGRPSRPVWPVTQCAATALDELGAALLGQHDGVHRLCGRAAARRSPRQSRSAYAVIASVRGIGVAVMMSWCGTRASCSPLCLQLQPLLDAEAVLLVDDHERELLERDAFLEQRVRADDDVHVAVAQSPRARAPRVARAASRQQRDRRYRAAGASARSCAKCCSASSSVGAITAVWHRRCRRRRARPSPRPRSCPQPTSPCSSRIHRRARARDRRRSRRARRLLRAGQRKRQRGAKRCASRRGIGQRPRALGLDARLERRKRKRCASSSSSAMRRCAGWRPRNSGAESACRGG